jgi:hypothetical protein
MKITHEKTNEVVRKVLLCKWLNLTPSEVEDLTLEEYILYGEVIVRLEGKSVL